MTRLSCASAAVLLLTLGGCSALTDTGRFREDGCDLTLEVRQFAPHLTDLFEVQVNRLSTTSDARSLVFKGISDPLGFERVRFSVPGVVPPRRQLDDPLHAIDFFADENNDGMFSGQPTDHSWIISDACDAVPNDFPHNTDFDDLPTPLPRGSFGVAATLCDELGSAFADGVLEFRVFTTIPSPVDGEPEVVRPLGFYRIAQARGRIDNLLLPGLIDTGFPYDLAVWSDTDADAALTSTDDVWNVSVNPSVGEQPYEELESCPSDPCRRFVVAPEATEAFVCVDRSESVLRMVVDADNPRGTMPLGRVDWVIEPN